MGKKKKKRRNSKLKKKHGFDKSRKSRTVNNEEKVILINGDRRLKVAFSGNRNMYLRDIQNFIVSLRTGMSLYEDPAFDIINSEFVDNVIIVVIPHLSASYIKDICTDNVFSKLKKNSNFMIMHSENTWRNYNSQVLFKMLGVQVLKGMKKKSDKKKFNIRDYLLTAEEQKRNRYPQNEKDYIYLENDYSSNSNSNSSNGSDSVIKTHLEISDLYEYLSITMNSSKKVDMNGNFLTQDAEKEEKEWTTVKYSNNMFSSKHIEWYARIINELSKISKSSSVRSNNSSEYLNERIYESNDETSSKKEEGSIHKENEDTEDKEVMINNNSMDLNDKDDKEEKKEVRESLKRESSISCGSFKKRKKEIEEEEEEEEEMEEEEDNNKNEICEENYEEEKESSIEKLLQYCEFDINNIFSIDCEMCETVKNKMELTKITIVDAYMNIVYDSYVLPENKITNYLTLYSGINEDTLKNVKTRLEDVQKDIQKILNKKSILIGHSLENDLHALKIIHPYVIDTSIIYKHINNFYWKPSLFNLCKKFLNITMNREKGHNSTDDAKISMFLALKKLSEYGERYSMGVLHPLSALLEKNNFEEIEGNLIYHHNVKDERTKNLCVFDSKSNFIEENTYNSFLKNAYYSVCKNDEEGTQSVITALEENRNSKKNKIKNYMLILRDYQNLCNEKIYDCIKNVRKEDFQMQQNENMYEIPTRVETDLILKKISQHIEDIYNNMHQEDAMILLSFNDNDLAEEKVKDTYFLAKEIFYSDTNIEEKLKLLEEKRNKIKRILMKMKKKNNCVNEDYYDFVDLLFEYDKRVINYLNENKKTDYNAFIMNSLTNLKNVLIGNKKSKEFNGWFSLLLK